MGFKVQVEPGVLLVVFVMRVRTRSCAIVRFVVSGRSRAACTGCVLARGWSAVRVLG